MPNRWVEFVKEWASAHNTTYGSALSNPEVKQEYKRTTTSVGTGSKPAGFIRRLIAEKQGYEDTREDNRPKLKGAININKMKATDTPVVSPSEWLKTHYPAKKKGRPIIHATAEEKYKAKLLSNKLRRQEKRASGKGVCVGKGQGSSRVAVTADDFTDVENLQEGQLIPTERGERIPPTGSVPVLSSTGRFQIITPTVIPEITSAVEVGRNPTEAQRIYVRRLREELDRAVTRMEELLKEQEAEAQSERERIRRRSPSPSVSPNRRSSPSVSPNRRSRASYQTEFR